jgi:peptidoglycan endopeptidase LytE
LDLTYRYYNFDGGEEMRKIIATATITLMLGVAYPITAAQINNTYYVVQPGDTLSKISLNHNISIQKLVELNQLTNPDFITDGQKLIIGQSGNNNKSVSQSNNLSGTKYIVKPGDTLSTISKLKGVSIQSIINANKIENPNCIFSGQVLIIPGSNRSNDIVSRSDPRTQSKSNVTQDQNIDLVDYATQFLGYPYCYGATGPNSFDCSGFTKTVYQRFGVQLPRVSADQAKAGKKVSKSDLVPGDLVFFETSQNRISHVGIYIGNNKFIHASSGRGQIIISALTDSYYKQRFVTAQRVL